MKLTPQDIHHKEFKRGMRGYSEEEVDLFLDQLAEQFEALYKQNHTSEEEIANLKESLETYKNMELTLQNTLLTAQKSAEEVQLNAKKEAEEMITSAKREAKRVLLKADKQKQALNETFAKLRSLETSFQSKIKENLEGMLGKLNSIVEDESTLIAEIEKEFAKAPELDIPVVENAPIVHEAVRVEEVSVVPDQEDITEEDPSLRADASKSDIASEADIDKFLQQEKLELPSEDTTSENKSGILGRIFKKKEQEENDNNDDVEVEIAEESKVEAPEKKVKAKAKTRNTKKQNTEEIKI